MSWILCPYPSYIIFMAFFFIVVILNIKDDYEFHFFVIQIRKPFRKDLYVCYHIHDVLKAGNESEAKSWVKVKYHHIKMYGDSSESQSLHHWYWYRCCTANHSEWINKQKQIKRVQVCASTNQYDLFIPLC